MSRGTLVGPVPKVESRPVWASEKDFEDRNGTGTPGVGPNRAKDWTGTRTGTDGRQDGVRFTPDGRFR